MKIASASVGMESARSFTTAKFSYRRYEETEFSNVLSGKTPEGEGRNLEDGLKENNKGKELEEKNSGSAKMATLDQIFEMQQKMDKVRPNYTTRNSECTTRDTIRYNSIMYILELLFGDSREKLRKWLDENSGEVDLSGNSNTADYGNELLNFDPAAAMQQKMVEFRYTAVDAYVETEDTTFSTKGIVKTADGREISFNIDVAMSRRFVQETRMDLGLSFVQTCDPLVINLDNNVAEVSDQKIRFDIDGDGELDTINQLTSRSGYLALDKNGDGEINDGNELFGAKSGDGFADLAQYDEDGNGWIDENDEIWNKLKIWVMDEKGRSQLYSLSKAGIGAICLQKAATDFAHTDNNNDAKAFIRSTGVFLYENGMAGTVQHLDLVNYSKEA
jgi:hypothetical protein